MSTTYLRKKLITKKEITTKKIKILKLDSDKNDQLNKT